MRKNFNLNAVYIVAAIVVVGTVLVVWVSTTGNLWVNGISHIANDVDGYHNKAHPVEGKYTVEIDLSDLESNEGNVLFDDGESQIYVSKVVHNESDYEVFFRSSGTYNSGGATLVSGIQYGRNKNGFTNNLKAEAQAMYRDVTYKLRSSSPSGLNYRDGDEFGFYLSPTSEKIDIDLEQETIIEVSVTNLSLNLWAKKLYFN